MRKVGKSMTVINLLHGFDNTDIVLCKRCYDKHEYFRATPAHMVHCTLDDMEECNELPIEEVHERLIPWMILKNYLEILKENLIDPRLVKHLAFIVHLGETGWAHLKSELNKKRIITVTGKEFNAFKKITHSDPRHVHEAFKKPRDHQLEDETRW